MNYLLTLIILALASINIYSFSVEKAPERKIAKVDDSHLDKSYYLSIAGKCLEADNKSLEQFVEKVVKSPKKKAKKLLDDFQKCQS